MSNQLREENHKLISQANYTLYSFYYDDSSTVQTLRFYRPFTYTDPTGLVPEVTKSARLFPRLAKGGQTTRKRFWKRVHRLIYFFTNYNRF